MFKFDYSDKPALKSDIATVLGAIGIMCLGVAVLRGAEHLLSP